MNRKLNSALSSTATEALWRITEAACTLFVSGDEQLMRMSGELERIMRAIDDDTVEEIYDPAGLHARSLGLPKFVTAELLRLASVRLYPTFDTFLAALGLIRQDQAPKQGWRQKRLLNAIRFFMVRGPYADTFATALQETARRRPGWTVEHIRNAAAREVLLAFLRSYYQAATGAAEDGSAKDGDEGCNC